MISGSNDMIAGRTDFFDKPEAALKMAQAAGKSGIENATDKLAALMYKVIEDAKS